MTTHELKTWPDPFDALQRGVKRFELRRYDRPFAVGDMLILQEYVPGEQRYTGRAIRAFVSYMLAGGSFGLPADLCILSLHGIEMVVICGESTKHGTTCIECDMGGRRRPSPDQSKGEPPFVKPPDDQERDR